MGAKLFYDFSGKYTFESRIDGLLKAIKVNAGLLDLEDHEREEKAPSSLAAEKTVSVLGVGCVVVWMRGGELGRV